MSEWWLLDAEELSKDPSAQRDRQVAYYNLLYATEEGRLFMNDLREMCFASNNIELIALYERIRNIAGRTRMTELAMIEAEASAIEIQESKEGEE